ncbi:MAG: hypothetical protein EBY16_01870 [Gammaproteobacteria bacterium]|nr:hypothetical protein [Gammaproteobacteria bacterium]
MTMEELKELAQRGPHNKAFFNKLFRLCHSKNYVELKAVLVICPEASHQSSWHRLYARCLLNENKYQEALDTLSFVPPLDNELIFNDLLICYEKLKLVAQGISLIDERLVIHNQADLVLKKVLFLNFDQRYEEVLRVTEAALHQFPDNQMLKVAHVQCLSSLKDRRFSAMMRVYNDEHPENIQLWMVYFWHLFYVHDGRIAMQLLMKIIHLFPVCIEAQLVLIKAYFLKGQIIDARLNLLFYQHMFKSEERALLKMDEMLKEHPQLKIEKSSLPSKVNLPPLLPPIFELLHVPELNVIYIVGSAIHRLIRGESLEGINDIDFISNIPPPPPSSRTAFSASRYMPNLYSHSIYHKGNVYKCEYFVKPLSSVVLIPLDVLTRDFTVNGLYCDNEGNIHDPTGLGLLDLEHGIIRTIVSSGVSINEDPIRILRAIKLILKGLRLASELEYAILEWTPQTSLNMPHINAVCAKLIRSFRPDQIIPLFKRFNLLDKMFKLRVVGLDDPDIYRHLCAQIESTAPRNLAKPHP